MGIIVLATSELNETMQVKCLARCLAQSKWSVNVSIVILISASAFESSGKKTRKAKPLSSHETKVSNDECHGTAAEDSKKETQAKGMLAYLSGLEEERRVGVRILPAIT